MRFMILLLTAVLSFLNFQDGARAATKDDKAKAEMMQKFMAAATPGAPHKILSDMAGEYTFTSKGWQEAGGKAMEGSGQASLKMILGGRWLQQTASSAAQGQMPGFEGMGLIGYDNVKKKYESIWLDTMGTGAMIGEGSFDASTKTLKDSGTYSCPATGKDRSYRSTWEIKDKNSMVFSLYGSSPFDASNKEFKMMELSFKRK